MTQFSSAHVSSTLLAGKLVFIVEAQVPIALLERSVALELGAAEVRCLSANEALAMIHGGAKPDLAIVDIADEATASSLIARLDEAGVALVVTSADPWQGVAGAAVIRITKPYLETELVLAIAAAMGARTSSA